MTKIDVTIFEKTESICPNCDYVRGFFQAWVEGNPQHTVTAVTLSAESNRDALIETGATSAPVYVVKRGKKETVISGRNPDILIDALNGVDGIWDV